MFDTVSEHHLVEDLSTRLSNERVIEVLLLGQRRGLVGDAGKSGVGVGRLNESELADKGE